MGYIYYIGVILFIIRGLLIRKSFLTQIYLMLMIIPSLQVGGHWYSGQYFVVLILLFLIFGLKLKKIEPWIANYVVTCILVILVYSVGFFLNNNTSSIYALLLPVLTMLKYPLIVICIGLLLCEEEIENIENAYFDTLKIVVIINLIVIVLQIFIPQVAAKLLDAFFYNDDSLNQIDAIAQGGGYVRYTGIYNYPSILGSVMLICLISFLYCKNLRHRAFFVGITLITGVASMSKSFYLGLAIVLILWTLMNFKLNDLKTTLMSVVVAITSSEIYIFRDAIYLWLRSKNAYLAYYFSCVFNLSMSLSTRYDASSGNTTAMLSMAKEHIVIGYGPLSVYGEVLQDSAFAIILHNGGIIALLIIELSYASLFINKVRLKRKCDEMLIIGIMVLGFAIPVWIFSPVTLGTIVYLYSTSSKLKMERKRFI